MATPQEILLQALSTFRPSKVMQGTNVDQLNIPGMAADPLAGGNIPTLTTNRVPPTYTPFIPQMGGASTDEREFQTKSGNRRIAANNMFSNIGGLIGTAIKNDQAKKARNVQMDVEKLFTAYQGLEQAKQDPNSPESKEIIQKNTQIINDMLSDPKKRKALEKAFNISFVGNDKNANSPERQGFNKAMQEWEKEGKTGLNPYGRRFQDMQPMVKGVNPALAAEAELIKAKVIPSADTRLRAVADKYVADMQYKGRMASETLRANGQLNLFMLRARSAQDLEMLKRAGVDTTEHLKHLNRLSEIGAIHNHALNEISLKAQADIGIKVINEAEKEIGELDKQSKIIQDRISGAHWYTNTVSLKAELADTKKQLDAAKEIRDFWRTRLDKTIGTELDATGAKLSGSSGSTSTNDSGKSGESSTTQSGIDSTANQITSYYDDILKDEEDF